MADTKRAGGGGEDRVNFSRSSAERIADAVRLVEQGNRNAVPFVSSPRVAGESGSLIRAGTFTGSWSVGTLKTVTFRDSTATASVLNFCNDGLEDAEDCDKGNVLFAKIGAVNYALEVSFMLTSSSSTSTICMGGLDFDGLVNYDVSKRQVLGHDPDDNCLQWFDVTDCSSTAS